MGTHVKTTQQQTHVNTNIGNDRTFELRIKIEMYEDHPSDKQIQKKYKRTSRKRYTSSRNLPLVHRISSGGSP